VQSFTHAVPATSGGYSVIYDRDRKIVSGTVRSVHLFLAGDTLSNGLGANFFAPGPNYPLVYTDDPYRCAC